MSAHCLGFHQQAFAAQSFLGISTIAYILIHLLYLDCLSFMVIGVLTLWCGFWFLMFATCAIWCCPFLVFSTCALWFFWWFWFLVLGACAMQYATLLFDNKWEVEGLNSHKFKQILQFRYFYKVKAWSGNWYRCRLQSYICSYLGKTWFKQMGGVSAVEKHAAQIQIQI